MNKKSGYVKISQNVLIIAMFVLLYTKLVCFSLLTQVLWLFTDMFQSYKTYHQNTVITLATAKADSYFLV